MSSSSTQERHNKFSATANVSESDSAPTMIGAAVADASVTPVTAFTVPDFGTRGALYALTARLAGRVNAANISEKEHEELLHERQKLLDKILDGSISRSESLRLEYVRWSLDTIEDAKHGYILDALEDAVAVFERFAADVANLNTQLLQRIGKRRR